jgi:hypothetical protein
MFFNELPLDQAASFESTDADGQDRALGWGNHFFSQTGVPNAHAKFPAYQDIAVPWGKVHSQRRAGVQSGHLQSQESEPVTNHDTPSGLVKSEAHFAKILESLLQKHPEGIRMCELKAVIRRDSGFWITEGVLGYNKLIKLVTCPTVAAVCYVTSDGKSSDHRVHARKPATPYGRTQQLLADHAAASLSMALQPSRPEYGESSVQTFPPLRDVIGRYRLPHEHCAHDLEADAEADGIILSL